MNIDFFLIGFVFILIHEMDAIRCHEWRIFPGLSSLNEKSGMTSFILLHIPLLYWIMTRVISESEEFIFGFDIFLIIHFFLHVLFLSHKRNEFKDWISWSIITAAGISGCIDLMIR